MVACNVTLVPWDPIPSSCLLHKWYTDNHVGIHRPPTHTCAYKKCYVCLKDSENKIDESYDRKI